MSGRRAPRPSEKGSPMSNFAPFLYTLVVYAVLLYALYWVIRVAVRHAINDTRRSASGPPDSSHDSGNDPASS
ncbi:MAG: hypothetical protein QOE61_1886 [Micromonosporaceae bacterium]|nr:hypothetical protein [Micromonosporaceae bacterium]